MNITPVILPNFSTPPLLDRYQGGYMYWDYSNDIAYIWQGSYWITFGSIGDINTLINHYHYYATSASADTVNDFRTYNNGTNLITEKCTVANTIKGAGAWIIVQSL